MSEITREEMQAKLDLVESRSETRFAQLDGKIDRVLDAVGNGSQAVEQLRGEIFALKAGLSAIKDDNKNTRWTIIVTVLASILAALGALWTTQSTLLSAFQVRLALPASSTILSPTK